MSLILNTGLRLLAGLAVVLACVGGSSLAHAQGEYSIKAAYLVNLLKFVSGLKASEPSPQMPMMLCVHGDDFFKDALGPVLKVRVQGRELQARNTRSIQELDGCDVVYITRSEQKFTAQVLGAVGGRPVLTVSDMPEFIEDGGMVGFTSSGNILRFRINLGAVRASGLDVSAKLLELALEVKS